LEKCFEENEFVSFHVLDVGETVVERADGNDYGGVCVFVESANSQGGLEDAIVFSAKRWFCFVEHVIDIVVVHDFDRHLSGQETWQENEQLIMFMFIEEMFFSSAFILTN
jgi:hypothetical protein